MELRRREGQEGVHDRLQAVDDGKGDRESPGGLQAVRADGLPRGLALEVAVGLPGQGHGGLERRSKPACLNRRSGLVDGTARVVQQLDVPFLQGASLRHPPVEVACNHGQDAVDQVPVGGDQLVVVAADVLLPGEVRVARLRHVGRQHVTKRVRVVPVQVVRQPDGPVPAGGELEPLQVEELVGGNVVGQVEAAVAQKHRRPDHGVERYVVLPHEVVRAAVLLPEVAPAVAAGQARLLRGRQIADHRLEPDVYAL